MTPPRIDPTAHDIRPEDNRLSRRSAVALTVVFLLLITLPGVLREFSSDAVRGAFAHIADWQDGKTVDRLRTVEKAIDNGAWTTPVRQQVQTVLYQVFREGNRKVVVGRDGWLFHRPGIRALTGRGPVLGPAKTSAKGHQKAEAWEGPIPVIKEFAAQLKERGIELVLVPVPDKAREYYLALPSLKVEKISDKIWRNFFVFLGEIDSKFSSYDKKFSTRKITLHCENLLRPSFYAWKTRVINTRHPSYQSLIQDISKTNLDVIDIDSLFISKHGWALGLNPRTKTDSHYSADAMHQSARSIVETDFFRTRGFRINNHNPILLDDLTTNAVGDLASSLGMPKSHEDKMHEVVVGKRPRKDNLDKQVSDPTSSIVLLGDSNVNMYDDPSLPFYMPGAGLGSWLSAYLGQPLHIIAINGGGATAVRQRFAALPDDVVRAKKLVIWVIAERDLFMDPAVARENGVEWKRVAFNPNKSPQPKPPEETRPADPAMTSDSLVIEATVKAKSAMPAPHEVNYPDSLYVVEFTVDKVISGTYTDPELQVVLWNFRNREVQPSARLAVGQKVRLTLSDWLAKGDLTKMNASDDIGRFDIPLLFAEKIEDPAP